MTRWLTLCLLLLSATSAYAQIYFGPPRLPVFNVKDYGAAGNGTNDDRLAIAAAVAAIPATGGTLFFPCGTYVTNSASALVSLIDKVSVTIQGGGAPCTTLKQNTPGSGATGPIIEVLTSALTSIGNTRIFDMTLNGNGTTGKCIDTLNAQEMVIERFSLTNCQNTGIDIRGVQNLHNIVRDGRITSPVGIVVNARGIKAVGNGNRVVSVYYNIGFNDASHYQVAQDFTGCAGCMSIGNLADGVNTFSLSDGAFTSLGDYCDTTSGGGGAVTTCFRHTAANPFTAVNTQGLTARTFFDFSSLTELQIGQYVTILGYAIGSQIATGGAAGIVQIGTSPVVSGGATAQLQVGQSTTSTTGVLEIVGRRTGAGSSVAQLVFPNSAIGGAEKRIGIIELLRQAADNTGDMLFYVANAGAINEVMRLTGAAGVLINGARPLSPGVTTQANLNTVFTANGQIIYCSDCTIANPCAAAGTGALAKRLNGVNVCN